MNEFVYTNTAQQVIFGAGSLDQLGQAADRFGRSRLLLCTIARFERSGLVGRLAGILGERLAAVYPQAQPHVPREQVEEAHSLASANEVDAVIGLGGGSPIGLAKAVSLALEEQRTGRPARAATPTDQPLFPVFAIPTTYAGSEMTPIYGVTETAGGITRKVTVTDLKVTPRLALYDPELTLDLTPEMTASTGINALAHCIEALYSITRNPVSTAAALEGTRHIMAALPRATANGRDLPARTEMLQGAHLAGLSLATVKLGLHHGLCHVLGGSAGVPHGIANSIILPHAMRFNLEVATAELGAAARAAGLAGQSDRAAAEALVAAVDELIGTLGLPRRLREAGVAESDLPRLAELALQSSAVRNNPRPVAGAAEAEQILRAAW